jgi:hypothetical protein
MWAVGSRKFWEVQIPKNTAELAKDFAFQAIIRRFEPGTWSIRWVGDFINSAPMRISAGDEREGAETILAWHGLSSPWVGI